MDKLENNEIIEGEREAMKKNDAISIVQVSLLIMTAIGLKNHVTVIPHLLDAAKRDAWLSVLSGLVLTIIWGILLLYIHKTTQPNNIFEWIEKNFGKKTKWMLSVPTSLVFVLLAAVSIKEFIAWTKITYLPFTPSFFTVTLVVLLCAALVATSLQTMSIVNALVLAFVIIFGFFVAFANIPQKDFSLLRPVLEHGFTPVFKGMIYPLSGNIELISLLFLQHKIYDKITFKAITINSIILSWLVMGPLIGGIIEFGPEEAARTRFPAYEEWRLVSIGRFVEHIDFFSIYQWSTGELIRVAFLLFLSIEVLVIKDKRKKRGILFIYSLIVLTLNLIPISDIILHHTIRHIVMPGSFWFFLAISILLTIFVVIKKRTRRRVSHVQKNEETISPSE